MMKGEAHGFFKNIHELLTITLASVKLLQGYCYFQRLLLYVMEKYPELKKNADNQIDQFIKNEEKRTKTVF